MISKLVRRPPSPSHVRLGMMAARTCGGHAAFDLHTLYQENVYMHCCLEHVGTIFAILMSQQVATFLWKNCSTA